jgi:tetratricopeptide (TPR) repeat protein
MDMYHDEAEQLVAKGREALDNNHENLALAYFEQAIRIEWKPLTCSSLAYCLAKVKGSYRESILLARKALELEPDDPAHYGNLGRILILSGAVEEGIRMLRQGLQYGGHIDIIRELERLGIRKPPIFKKLARSHPVNKYLGLQLSRLGLR